MSRPLNRCELHSVDVVRDMLQAGALRALPAAERAPAAETPAAAWKRASRRRAEEATGQTEKDVRAAARARRAEERERDLQASKERKERSQREVRAFWAHEHPADKRARPDEPARADCDGEQGRVKHAVDTARRV
eukprot:gene12174-biopygen11156